MTIATPAGLRVLVVDDEPPAVAELAYLLSLDLRVSSVRTANDGQEALRILKNSPVDALFLDIRLPGLEIAALLNQFATPPQIIFVTAHEEFAIEAFDLHASDYLLKPVRAERLAEAIRRMAPASTPRRAPESGPYDVIPVELAGVTRFIPRQDVSYAEAQGDYVRLYTATSNHLVRIPLAVLEEHWSAAGFARIHRRFLVRVEAVSEARWESGHLTVIVGGTPIPVARRHTHEVRERLSHR
ncbi:response regulator transcription factor [Catenulispora sp. NL8]|uniref:Response regulator transcription factor n=1 Tax=Catenulispora pinistramenti TaxID=2705254 RepID=A0ABS5KKE0_9ACTN|nr:LytTR family DNA-binding domain-containing protein [Catenulispora pinistramenti]MBS2546006.1 response regulator transcription factor [Catenulispora pinistramenti]